MQTATLPINAFHDQIVDTVNTNRVTIVVADTGAGKSTQLPWWLMTAGYEVVVTQPRRLAARTVSARVAEEHNSPLGEAVGYRTAYEQLCSDTTDCLYVTDGLALVNELTGNGQQTVLVIDEVHEWNLNIEVLVAWIKQRLSTDRNLRIVLMSATLEADKLSRFFNGAPIINVPGRLYPVEEVRPGDSLEDDTARLLRQDRNVLVFVPGVGEIEATIKKLHKLVGGKAVILGLHGQMDAEEQAKCFRRYDRPKCVVATNVAQTSVTIEDIDAVVDSGMERRVELRFGVEGLYLLPISRADSDQRKGRAGRTKLGIYIDHCPVLWDMRPSFPTAEILRVRLDQVVLRLASFGFDADRLEFFHQPDKAKIRDARQGLITLGCMDQAGKITATGKLVAALPTGVQAARMIVEADRLGVIDDVITIASILEQGGVNARKCSTCQSNPLVKSCSCWRRLAAGVNDSDLMAQYVLYEAAHGMSKQLMADSGISPKAYFQIRERRNLVAKALRGKVRFGSSGKRENILRAICAGMVGHLYYNAYGDTYADAEEAERKLTRHSVVEIDQWVVGQPWDLEIQTDDGPRTLRLVRMATRVQEAWLREIAPGLVHVNTGVDAHFDFAVGEIVSSTVVIFNGREVRRSTVRDSNHPEAKKILAAAVNDKTWRTWTDRPEIAMPVSSDQSEFPPVRVHIYGEDALDGTPLEAYGALQSSRYLSRVTFSTFWTRNRDEAQRAHDESAALWVTASEYDRLASQFEQLKRQAQALADEADRFRREHYGVLETGLESRLYHAYFRLRSANDADALDQWRRDTQALLQQSRQSVADNQAQKASLHERARSLRNDINGLLHEHLDDLDDRLYHRLCRYDVDDDWLPSTLGSLRTWVSEAEALIAETRRSLSLDVADDGDALNLTALAAKFNQ